MTEGLSGATARVRELWANGDQTGAYALAVATTKDSLYRFLLHLLHDQEAAREIFQETYVRVYQGLGSFRGDASLTTWVLRIARNTAWNEARRLKVRRGREVPLEPEDADPPAPDASLPIVGHPKLAQAMSRLPGAQREAVLLFYLEDLSVAEIAAITGRPANTVKSDLMRARATLRSALSEPAALPRAGFVLLRENEP